MSTEHKVEIVGPLPKVPFQKTLEDLLNALTQDGWTCDRPHIFDQPREQSDYIFLFAVVTATKSVE